MLGTSFLLSSQALLARDLMLANGSVYTLDRNLFDLEARDISDTEVLATLFEGAVVFGTLAWEAVPPWPQKSSATKCPA